MTVKDIYDYLDALCPFDSALDFDNAGLLIGSYNSPVEKAVVSLDCTKAAVKQAKDMRAELIITHHPVIFGGIKAISSDSIYSDLIKSGINVISAHTNLDSADGGVNDCLVKTLGLENTKKIVCADGFSFRRGSLPFETSPAALAKYAGEKLNFSPRFVEGNTVIKTVAVCGGSGGDFLQQAYDAGCEAYITAECKHHVFIQAENLGITLIDCGHFATEDVVTEPLKNNLQAAFPDIVFAANHESGIKCF